MAFKEQLVRDLESFGKVVHTSFSDPDEPRAFQRDAEIETLLRYLTAAHHSSLLLVGPSGSGKTAMIHELARRLAFRGSGARMMLETSTSLLMSGTVYLGEWQTRLHDLLQLATRKNRVILYINDMANLIGAGRHSRSDENMAASIAPLVERDDVVLLGECQEESYRVGIDRHLWFRKLFNVAQIQPLKENAVKHVIDEIVLQRGREAKEKTVADLQWQPEALSAVQHFGGIYFPGITPPGGAVQLIDHLITLKRDKVEKNRRRKSELSVTRADVVEALHSLNGLPVHLVDDSQSLHINKVREFFEARVIAQDEALSAVVDLIALVKAGLTDPTKPLGTMLFVGPTGVGKTELAKALAEFIFGSSRRMIRLDMSEYKDYNSFEKLIGSQSAENDYGKSGSLLSRVRGQPFSVILLDEIEKAHPNVFDLLLQLFDDGRLTDAMGQTTDFTQTIIIMTSNLGGEINDSTSFGFGPESTGDNDSVLEAVKGFFRPELVNRIDRIVRFRPLRREHIRILAQRELGNVLLRGGITRRQLRVDVERGVYDVLADAGFDPHFGARPLKRAVERLALLPIARLVAESNADNRPAMLRLIPEGKRIKLKVVHDRQSRKSETLVKGVVLKDSSTARNKKVSRKQILEEKDNVERLVSGLQEEHEALELRQLRSKLVQQTGTPDFWDDPPGAREVLADLYRTERLLEGIALLRRRTDDVLQQLDTALKNADQRRVGTAARRIREITQHAQLVQYSLRCRDRFDRCDAFVAITAVDDSPEDNVGRLADMYCGWARRKGFYTKLVHEELFSPKISKEVVLLIEGVAIYGLLSTEDGLHEFVYDRTSKAPRKTHFAKVRVMAAVDQDVESLRNLMIVKKALKGPGLRTKRFHSQVQVTHPKNGTTVHLQNGLTTDESAEMAKELLAADIRRTSGPPAPANNPETVVRRYTLRPKQSAKDSRTGHVTHNLGELWKGGLDDFIAKAIVLRDSK